jgi:Rrf2 family protein
MMFTTKTEYGLRALAALAKNENQRPLSVAQIAKDNKISRPYLEQIFSLLKADDLVTSVKGAEGGYGLARDAKKINIFEVVEALEGPLAVFYCMSSENNRVTCSSKNCLTKKVWDELQRNLIRTLRKFTLADLI